MNLGSTLGNGLEAAKTNIRDGWGLRRAMGECSSLPQPPDLGLDQLERVKKVEVGIWAKQGTGKKGNLKSRNWEGIPTADAEAEGGRVWLLMHVYGGRGKRVRREGDEVK